MQNKTAWVCILMVVLFCGCASQDDLYSLDHRISVLEKRNAALENQNRELKESNQGLLQEKEKTTTVQATELEQVRGKVAGLAAQLEQEREKSQMLSGRMEEMQYLLNQKLSRFEDVQLKNGERMDYLAADAAAMQKRIDAIDQYLNLEGTSSKSANKPASQSKSTSEQKLYDGAKKAFDDGNLKEARNGFVQLINDYPKSPHADNSQFWIGETYYQEKWYEKAILEYQKVIENYPTGNKVPAALLKQGLSFINIGEPNNARLVLKELTAKYPSTNEARIAKRKLATLN